jgi:hypothetical protein
MSPGLSRPLRRRCSPSASTSPKLSSAHRSPHADASTETDDRWAQRAFAQMGASVYAERLLLPRTRSTRLVGRRPCAQLSTPKRALDDSPHVTADHPVFLLRAQYRPSQASAERPRSSGAFRLSWGRRSGLRVAAAFARIRRLARRVRGSGPRKAVRRLMGRVVVRASTCVRREGRAGSCGAAGADTQGG